MLYRINFGENAEYQKTFEAKSREMATTLCYDFMAQRSIKGDVCYIDIIHISTSKGSISAFSPIIEAYIEAKIVLLEDFCINVTDTIIKDLCNFHSEISIDNYCKTLIAKALGA